MTQFEREDIKHREEQKAAKTSLKKALANVEKEQKKLGEAKGEYQALTEDIPRLEGEVASITANQTRAQSELDEIYESLKKETEPLVKKIEACQKKREPDVQALTAVKAEENLAQSELDLILKKVHEADAERAAAQADLDAHAASVKESKHERKACEKEAAELEAKLEAAQQVADACAEKEPALLLEERTARAKYEEGMSASKEGSGREKMLNGLMGAKRDGRIPGIIGRLGSLGSIDAKYDVAASTCCGALDNIVVADTASAQSCVSLLRENNLGVATFIILDKQAAQMGPQMAKAFSAPKDSKRLFDLLTIPNEEHKPAFYSAFRDTLVCEDKAKASKIALGGSVRHRVVTTDGVVINTSGTMEGGGKPSRARSARRPRTRARCRRRTSPRRRPRRRRPLEARAAQGGEVEALTAVKGLQKDIKNCITNHTKITMQVKSERT